ncbi:MAG TPA: DUF2339 domain-containing protein [Blastocatellia bacterium]|nr:DUF2339 domain-containing protein [Blastocatellia bacterium]
MAEDNHSQNHIAQIIERLTYLESIMREQTARIYAIEQRLGLAPRPAAPPPPPAKQPAPEKAADRTQPKPAMPPPIRPIAPPSFGDDRQQAAPPPLRERGDLEARIGGNWFNRIGIIAICIGVGFFLKYAFENEWIGPSGRVAIGVAVGMLFLAGGERLRARYAGYAYGLSGGGILILYLSVFAAFAYYQLIEHWLAFLLMALVTTTAVLLAARYSAPAIAVLGLIGGFLTPILLSTGVDNQVGLFGYIALLDAGVLALAYSKQWRSLNYLAFAGTQLMFFGWFFEYYHEDKLRLTIFFLTLFFLIFALLAVLHNVVNCKPAGWLDLFLVLINALFYFSTSYRLLDEALDETQQPYLGAFAVLMAGFYLGLSYFAHRKTIEDRRLILIFLGLAFLFLALAVPIQFDQHWVTMGWAIEGAALTWIGLRVADRTSRYAGFVVLLVATLHWFGIDALDFAYSVGSQFTPLLNRRALSCAVLIAALALAARFHHRLGEKLTEEERGIFAGLYALGANALAVTLLSLDAADYFEQQKALAAGRSTVARLENSQQFALSAIWTVYGAIALFVGIRRGLKALRFASILLLCLATLKALTVDIGFHDAAWHTPLLNQTFGAFALLILALACAVWLYTRSQASEERAVAVPVMIVAANLLAIIALSAEASGYFEARMNGVDAMAEAHRDFRLARQLSLSVIWTIYGGAMLVIGIARNSRLLRVMALLLLGLTIGKVFLVDLSSLSSIYRIVSFIVLGAILLAVSFLYQQYRQRAAQNEQG